jgi:hypothetical protein
MRHHVTKPVKLYTPSDIGTSVRHQNLMTWTIINPSSRTMAMGSTQASNRNEYQDLPGDKGRQARKAYNLTVICEPIV